MFCKISPNIIYARIKNAIRGKSVSGNKSNSARHSAQKYTVFSIHTKTHHYKKNGHTDDTTTSHNITLKHRSSSMLLALFISHGLEHIRCNGCGNSTGKHRVYIPKVTSLNLKYSYSYVRATFACKLYSKSVTSEYVPLSDIVCLNGTGNRKFTTHNID
jgi:hypothetical protein